MTDALKLGFGPFAAPGKGVLVVFCDDGLKFGDSMTGAQCPVVADSRTRPGVGPLARITAKIDSRGRVADREQRARNDFAFRGDEAEGAVA